jgi:thiamine-monophosphate kinase
VAEAGGEDRLLAWLREQPGTELLGDDTAFLPPGPWRATVDSQIEGVHVPPGLDPAIVARRLLQVNLSDLAASGGLAASAAEAGAAYALLALSAPEGFDHRAFFTALLDECAATGVRLAGGDLARSPTLTATLTLFAPPPSGTRGLHRRGARPGDRLWVGGTLGESGAGQRLLAQGARPEGPSGSAIRDEAVELPEAVRRPPALARAARSAVVRHLRPRAQLTLGARLAESGATAAMDLSDGLARDLPRLAAASEVGARVEADTLPLAEGFDALCAALGEDPIDLALAGGEDYVLLFTLPTGQTPPKRSECKEIGEITEEPRLVLVREGKEEPWPETGWDHLGP